MAHLLAHCFAYNPQSAVPLFVDYRTRSVEIGR